MRPWAFPYGVKVNVLKGARANICDIGRHYVRRRQNGGTNPENINALLSDDKANTGLQMQRYIEWE